MWIKVILCIAIIAFSLFVSFLMTGKYRARKTFFQMFLQFQERFLNELTYLRRPISAFFSDFSEENDFIRFIKNSDEPPDYLHKEEQAHCIEYRSMLGRGNSQSQIGYFGAQEDKIRSLAQSSSDECVKKSALYLKLGLLTGLAIVILIV